MHTDDIASTRRWTAREIDVKRARAHVTFLPMLFFVTRHGEISAHVAVRARYGLLNKAVA